MRRKSGVQETSLLSRGEERRGEPKRSADSTSFSSFCEAAIISSTAPRRLGLSLANARPIAISIATQSRRHMINTSSHCAELGAAPQNLTRRIIGTGIGSEAVRTSATRAAGV